MGVNEKLQVNSKEYGLIYIEFLIIVSQCYFYLYISVEY